MDVIGTLQAYDPSSLSKLQYYTMAVTTRETSINIPTAKFVIVFPGINYGTNSNGALCVSTPILLAPGQPNYYARLLTRGNSEISVRLQSASQITASDGANNGTILTIAVCPA